MTTPANGETVSLDQSQNMKCKSAYHRDDKVGGEESQPLGNCGVGMNFCLNADSGGCSSLSTNLDCTKFIASTCASMPNSNNEMFGKIIDCLLQPVYHELKKGTERALSQDQMPGNFVVAGGSSSLGKASASPDLDSSLESKLKQNLPSHNNSLSLPPVNNYGSSTGKQQHHLGFDVQTISVSQGLDRSTDDHHSHHLSHVEDQHTPRKGGLEESELFNACFPSVVLCPMQAMSFRSSVSSPHCTTTNDVGSVLLDAISKCSKHSFGKQSLMTLVENDDDENSVNGDLSNVAEATDAVIVVDRNIHHQFYMLHDLKGSYHFTVGNEDIECIQRAWPVTQKSSSIPFLHVPSSSNYASRDNKLVVINTDTNIPDCCKTDHFRTSNQRPLQTLSSLLNKMFLSGVSDYFSYDNKKRSSKSQKKKNNAKSAKTGTKRGKRRRSSSQQTSEHKRASLNDLTLSPSSFTDQGDNAVVKKHVIKSNLTGCSQREVEVDENALPVISLGWSMQDCTQYGSNLASIAGNVKPFICDGNLPKSVKSVIVEIVEAALKFLPREWAFNVERCSDEEVIKLRSSMFGDFKEALNGDRDTTHFRVEGITIIIPLSIGLHKDTLNCMMEGMRSVISFNCQIPMNEKTIPDGKGSRLWVWLQKNGYSTAFPCSMILYSRKHVHYYCEKVAKSLKLSKKDSVRKCLHWAMLSRVGSVTDYRSRVWNNQRFPSLFNLHSRKIKNSRFGGCIWTTPACYDKTVRCSFCLFVLLSTICSYLT